VEEGKIIINAEIPKGMKKKHLTSPQKNATHCT
jgi:hypothetical protein